LIAPPLVSESSDDSKLSRETKQNMLIEMLKCSTLGYKINEIIKAEEVYKFLDLSEL
jgi:hypothetical protein